MEQQKTILDVLKGRTGKAIRSLQSFMWTDRATVTRESHVRDGRTGKMIPIRRIDYISIPCHLSFREQTYATERDLPEAQQNVLLLVKPDVKIEAGSVISVIQGDGRHMLYASGSVAAVYHTHQEIVLKKYDKRIGKTKWE